MAATAVVLIGLFAGYIAVFGIPKEYKRAMEEKALETMGEVRFCIVDGGHMKLMQRPEQNVVHDQRHAGQGARFGAEGEN